MVLPRRKLLAFVKTGKDFEESEKAELRGQLQDTIAAHEIYELLKISEDVPAPVHVVVTKQVPMKTILDYVGEHLDKLE